MVEHRAILIETSPQLKCCIFTPKYGPITVTSDPDDQGKPNVDSISLLRINDLASTFIVCSDSSHLSNLQDYEENLFSRERSSHSTMRPDGNPLDRDQHQFMEEVTRIKGLKERLIDTSLSSKINVSKGSMLEFVHRSEAIIQELLSAHLQYSQKQEQSKKRSIHDDTEDKEYSVEYFRSLHIQCNYVQTLLDSIEGEGHVLDLNGELTKITIQVKDAKERVHILVGALSPDFPAMQPIWTCDLPTDFHPEWKPFHQGINSETANKCSGGLYDCVKSYLELISLYQPLWNELEDIDAYTWVLEPTLPSKFSCTDRRIMLRPGLSIAFTIEPEHPRSLPLSMRLIGKDDDIDVFRDRYKHFTSRSVVTSIIDYSANGTSNYWSEMKSLRQNLECCFQIELPQSSTTNASIDQSECAVCYAYSIRSEDEINDRAYETPDVKCSNSSCSRSYHRSCLMEWLQSLPGSKTSFGRVFGSCPYCYESISVSAT